MKRTNTSVLLLIMSFLLMTLSCTKSDDEVIIDDFSDLDTELIARGFTGVVLVAQNDDILFNKAYGRKNSQENGFNDINTVFDMGSITKQFTAAGILKLEMQNELSVNYSLSEYFDNVPNDKENITIHQLLTHSSGLVGGIGGDYETITEEDFIEQVFDSELISPVGERFNYSNVGYSLLGLIIEKVSGMDYESFLNSQIFQPSNMHHTGYIIPEWQENEVANGYLNGVENNKPNEENWSDNGPYLNLKGNGGILTRASDLLLWSQSIMNNIVLDEAATNKYLFPHFQPTNIYDSYGYGWGIENNDSENKLVLHGGTTDFFASDMWIYPNKGITIVVLSNELEAFVYTIARGISNFLLAE